MDEQATLNITTQQTPSEILPVKDTIILKLLDELPLKNHMHLLEIGPVDGAHLPYILQKTRDTTYFGVYGTAPEANHIFSNYKGDRRIQLSETTAGRLHFQDAFFDCCFMVHQIYFWNAPLTYFAEIYRVLKPRGKMHLAFVEKRFGDHLPWTHVDFNFHGVDKVKSFFRQAGFVNIMFKEITETILDPDGTQMKRPYIVISGQKYAS